ncbi:MAG: DUF3667 domain-containing protein [Xanthomonadales bacterium]|nr:DUF3667 domain-containing protein [Xanthomonadales bacterium]
MGELEPSVSPSGPLTLHEALREARHDWLDLEHGALGTLIDMTVRPAKVMRAYLYERRRDYVRPLRYLLFSVAAQVAASYALLSSAFMQEQVQKQGEEVARAHWLLDNAAVLTLVLLPLIAGVLRLCFMRHGVRYVDALVVATYSQAQLNLFAAALVAPAAYFGGLVLPAVLGTLTLVYAVYAWASFPSVGRWWTRTLLAVLALLLCQGLNSALVWLVMRWM